MNNIDYDKKKFDRDSHGNLVPKKRVKKKKYVYICSEDSTASLVKIVDNVDKANGWVEEDPDDHYTDVYELE